MVELQNLYYNEKEIFYDYFRLYIYSGYQRGKHKFIKWATVIRDMDADTKLRLLILSSSKKVFNMYASKEEFKDFIPIEKNRDFCKLIVKAIFSKLMGKQQ